EALHHIRSVSVHPAIDDTSAPESFIADSARLQATFDILDRIHRDGERALVFIESIRMQHRFAELARQRYGLNRIDIINGSTPIPQRQAIVKRFQSNLGHGPSFDLLILGPKAAGTGLTLTAATHVIHLSRWWNPAVEEQCNDRVHRIGQTRPVNIHVPMAIHPAFQEGSFDCLLHSLMCRKRRLATSALWPMGDEEDDVATLRQGLEAAAKPDSQAETDPLAAAIRKMFERDGIPVPAAQADGSYPFS
ncbi:MAG: DEAD/DEAH box helicase, partial [Alphaproteobacteria bacterium]